jgi:hypothetical protein
VVVPVAPERSGPHSIGGHAADNLRFIRQTMERSATFTAIPGAGGVAMGVVGIAGALLASRQPSGDRWLVTWLGAAAVAAILGLIAMARKARQAGSRLTGANGRRFALGMAAPFVAGAAITYTLWGTRTFSAMPPVWLLLYGAGVLTGGAYSINVVRVIGLFFMSLGVISVVTPPEWGNVWLGIGFGAVHLGFGLYIARYHGG